MNHSRQTCSSQIDSFNLELRISHPETFQRFPDLRILSASFESHGASKSTARRKSARAVLASYFVPPRWSTSVFLNRFQKNSPNSLCRSIEMLFSALDVKLTQHERLEHPVLRLSNQINLPFFLLLTISKLRSVLYCEHGSETLRKERSFLASFPPKDNH